MIKHPCELMTRDDWIHASNVAKEIGGHFMGFLARAYQHADSGNAKPIREAYAEHFWRFLDEPRRQELRELFDSLALATNGRP